MGDQLFVVVSDPHMARDLLVNNGAIFSSRKKYFMKNQTILHGRAITASQYGDKWCVLACRDIHMGYPPECTGGSIARLR
jgi:hypothetical protein